MKHGFLPSNVEIVGFARTEMSDEDFRKRIGDYLTCKSDQDKAMAQEFKRRCHYVSGNYDDAEHFRKLHQFVLSKEVDSDGCRIYYYALPPPMFYPVSKNVRQVLYDANRVHRVIVEKPFGKDLESSNELSAQLSSLFREEEIYRIDHYLGKEMVKNIMVLRFANVFMSGIWNKNFINNVQITFKEPFGTEGRGGYFDEYGIIRDVIQNHLLQVLSVISMERPVSLNAEDIRDEKVKVLKCISPLTMDNLLLGQYASSLDGKKPSYLDDKTVPPNSNSPTFAAAVLFIENERWTGVPFILKAGKALNEKKAEIRIQFDDVPGMIYKGSSRNELVIRVQPDEAVYLKMISKKPGLSDEMIISELDLSYNTRYSDVYIPDAYEALILDVLNGNGSNFVRSDELEAAWKIFTPALHRIERENVQPIKYPYGTRGPSSLDDFVKRFGFQRHTQEYLWQPSPKTKL